MDDSSMTKSALLFTPYSFHPANLTASLSVRTIFIFGTDSCLYIIREIRQISTISD